MTHCARRSRARVGHQTVTGPVTPTCLHDRWGRVEATQTALGEALVMRRRTRVRFPPPPLIGWRTCLLTVSPVLHMSLRAGVIQHGGLALPRARSPAEASRWQEWG